MLFDNFNYEKDSIEKVYKATDKYFELYPEILKKINDISWLFFKLWNLIPETMDNIFSGHSFPAMEAWEEIKVSSQLCKLGYYKQSYISLRNALELSLLAIYFNIDDNGPEKIQSWLRSRESIDSNTPRIDKIWKVLLSNENIQLFNAMFDIKGRYYKLSYLSNYVHTKGTKFSNRLGLPKGNTHDFEESGVNIWIKSFFEITIIITTIFLLRYPIGIIRYNWYKKCGIDNPYPVLEEHEIDIIYKILPNSYIEKIIEICRNDKKTQDLYKYITDLPDMTENDVEEQIIRLDEMEIQGGIGFIEWEKKERKQMEKYTENERKIIECRIEKIKRWAEENDFMNCRIEKAF